MRALARIRLWAVAALCAPLGLMLSGVSGCSEKGVHIVSYQLRDRAITFQQPMMRSSLIIGFKVEPGGISSDRLSVEGELSRDGLPLGIDSIPVLDGLTGSLGFDIPHQADLSDRERIYSIPDGLYAIQIYVKERDGRVLAQLRKEFRRNQLGRTFVADGHVYPPLQVVQSLGEAGRQMLSTVSASIDNEESMLYVHSLQGLPFSGSVTLPSARLNALTIQAARDETMSVVISLKGKRTIGAVSLDISSLVGDNGLTLRGALNGTVLRELTDVLKEDTNNNTLYVRRNPRLIEPGKVSVEKDEPRSFLLTCAIPAATAPGMYHGSIGVLSHSGKLLTLPVILNIVPLTLPEPDIIYGMMMDYAFYELDNQGWSISERHILEQRGREIYQDLRDHCMTTAYPHSHFFYMVNEKGEPVLDSLRSALLSFRESGFSGPFVWYLGHLLNTAKPKHPGSILLYDEEVAERRLRDLLPRFEKMAREAGVPKARLVVQLVDEPDKSDRLRTKAAKKLNAIARELGFRTLITRPWPDVDIMCTVPPANEAEAARLRGMGNEWWIYPNEALTGMNLCYTRYVFGFGAWHWGVKGVVPWTYQMSQGSNGNPFTVLDGPEIMVTYPGKDGPITTPTWETIREGINDYRYILLLTTLIDQGKKQGNPVALRIDQELTRFKASLGPSPGPAESQEGDWSPDTFEKRREQIVDWILELSRQNSRPRQRAS